MQYIIMGVSGSGKSTVGQLLAAQLDVPFYDADDYHPPENIAKMSSGKPLNDDDRLPWLNRLHDLMRQHDDEGSSAVLACSALKQAYRDRLRGQMASVQVVYLDGSFDVIWQRMQQREAHYMKAEMLQSQFDTLEIPTEAEASFISIEQSPEKIVERILQILI